MEKEDIVIVDCDADKLKTYTLTITGQELNQIENGLSLVQQLAKARPDTAKICEDCLQVAHDLAERLDEMEREAVDEE